MHSGTRPGTGLARGFAAPLPPKLRHGAALGSAAPWWGLSVGGAERVGAWPPWARGWHRDSSELGLRMSPWPQYSHPKDTQRTPKGHPMATPLGAPCPGSAGSRSHRAQAPRPTGSPCCAPLPFPPLPSPPLPSLSSPPLRPPLPSPASGARSFSSSFLSFFQFFFSHIDAAGGREPARRTARARRWGRGWRQPRSTHGAPGPRRGALGPRLGAPGPHHGANSRGEAAAERRSAAGQPWAIRQHSGPAEGRGKGQLLPRSPPGPLPLPIEHGNAFCFRILYAAAAPSTCCPRPVCPSTRLAPSAEASGGSGLKARCARGPRASSSLQNLGCNKWVLLPELCRPCGHRDVQHVPPRLSVCPSVCPCSRTRCCLGLPGDAALSAGL